MTAYRGEERNIKKNSVTGEYTKVLVNACTRQASKFRNKKGIIYKMTRKES